VLIYNNRIVKYKMIYSEAKDIRGELAKRLGHAPNKRVWEYLVSNDFIEEVETGHADINDLEEKYKVTAQSPPHLLGPTSPPSDSRIRRIRLEILSDLLAEDAGSDPMVISFRERHLPSGLITTDEVGKFISNKSADDGEPTTYLKVPLPDGHELTWDGPDVYAEPSLTLSKATPATGYTVDLLHYSQPGDVAVTKIAVRRGGILDGLRQLSESLSGRYAWQKPQATVFVLTGVPPLLSSLRGGARLRPSQPISSRITMEIDPTLTPKEVVEGYKKLRDRWIKGRYRSMSEKHLRLAEFYKGSRDMTWYALMTEWNRMHKKPDWRYSESQNFARDCKHAWERLMGEDLLQYVDRQRR
jgi:hypothetical protein